MIDVLERETGYTQGLIPKPIFLLGVSGSLPDYQQILNFLSASFASISQEAWSFHGVTFG